MEVHSCQEQYFCPPVLLYFIGWFSLHHAPDDCFEAPSLVQGLLRALAKTRLPVTAGGDVILNLPSAVARSGIWQMAAPAAVLQPGRAGSPSWAL